MPETYRVIIQPEAQRAMESAYLWIEADSPRRAQKWAQGLQAAIASLATFPQRCALAPENAFFAEEIRHHLYGTRRSAYRILFTIQEQTVHVLYFRHSAQDWVRPETTEEGTEEEEP